MNIGFFAIFRYTKIINMWKRVYIPLSMKFSNSSSYGHKSMRRLFNRQIIYSGVGGILYTQYYKSYTLSFKLLIKQFPEPKWIICVKIIIKKRARHAIFLLCPI